MVRDMLKRSIPPTLATLVLIFGPAATLAQANPLDGKVYVGEAGEKGKPADEKDDVISFADGKFHSSACDKWGFGKGAYSASANGEAIAFEVETSSEKHGRLAWKGTAKGDTLEGTFVHYRKPSFFRPSPDPIEHWFKATLKR